MTERNRFDAIIIGGGFYGCVLALFLAERHKSVLLIEQEPDLMRRASYTNQARVHHGYHYPRSFMTAWRSSANFPRFVVDFRECIDTSFEKVYAIARQQSKVSGFQFRKFCGAINAPIREAPQAIRTLFDERLIEQAFIVTEYAFNADILRELLRTRLERAGVGLLLATAVVQIGAADDDLEVCTDRDERFTAPHVYNCTYAQLNTILGSVRGEPNTEKARLPLKHEIAEMALVRVPEAVRGLGVTVMDGPFFSVMPFPAAGLHSLSHVRYTPHESWSDQQGYRNAYDYLAHAQLRTSYPYMIHDVQRYMPIMRNTEYVRSLFEIKTVLTRNEQDDGRPILFREEPGLSGLFSIMGGKLDNIYDVLGRIDQHLNLTESASYTTARR